MKNAFEARVAVAGSDRAPVAQATAGPLVPGRQRLAVTVQVRPRAAPTTWLDSSALADALPQARAYLSREELAAQLGADPADLAAVADFAQTHGLRVVGLNAAARSVHLAGSAAAFGAAFGTALHEYASPAGPYRGRVGPLTVPAPLGSVVEGVFGLDNRPQAEAHFRCQAHAAGPSSFTPPELARLYDFPAGLDGAGQCIGLIELGGGFRPADLRAYFGRLGLAVPAVRVVRVDGARNQPSTAGSADNEVLLDLEVAAAVAPAARLVVYFAPNTAQGFLNAVLAAVHDTSNRPSVISISWGGPEDSWTAQARQQFDEAFQAAALLGVTVCCAAGDGGFDDGVGDGQARVDFPAASPYALACGGTRLTAGPGGIVSEVVWNDGPTSATGGGESAYFPVPAYQHGLAVRPSTGPARPLAGRGLPDVAAHADPATGYQVRVDGTDTILGGTSAVAPLWAGLLARLNQRLPHPVGFLNPLLYGSLAGRGLLRDIDSGTNGAYLAQPGWDACTGWGSPHGQALLDALVGPVV